MDETITRFHARGPLRSVIWRAPLVWALVVAGASGCAATASGEDGDADRERHETYLPDKCLGKGICDKAGNPNEGPSDGSCGKGVANCATEEGSDAEASGDGGGDDMASDDGAADQAGSDDGASDDGASDDGGYDDGGSDDGGYDDGGSDDGGYDDGGYDDGGYDDGGYDDGGYDDGGGDDGGGDGYDDGGYDDGGE